MILKMLSLQLFLIELAGVCACLISIILLRFYVSSTVCFSVKGMPLSAGILAWISVLLSVLPSV